MAAEFNELGFRFLYPENWKLVCEDNRGWPRSVSVHSPQGAFWAATIDRGPADELLQRVVQVLQQEYEDAEIEPIERQLAEFALQGVELRFYCLDLLVTAQVLRCANRPIAAVLLLQGENRDFDELVRVFDAVSLSFLRHQTSEV
jgi:hypothetical protein